MDFSWQDEQNDLFESTLQFAKKYLAGNGFSRESWRGCAEAGLLGLSVPEPFGGTGLDALTTAHVMEAFGEGCDNTGLMFAVAAHLFACLMPIVENGNMEQKTRFLPSLCDGRWVGANAITEAEAGSDLAAIKTRAIPEGGEYLISGEKTYVTNGPSADIFLVYASTKPSHGYMGISAFVVERAREGVQVGQAFEKMGLNGAQTGAVYFDNCRVPAANRLGAEGEGLNIFNRSMNWERSCLFAGYLGAMNRDLVRVIDHAKQRKQFRKSLGKNQAVSHRIADMKWRLESARLLLYRACWAMDRGEAATLAVSLAKLAVSEAAVASGLDAIRIFGGSGCMMETGVPRGLLDAVPCTIFSGTSDMQRNLIAQALGL